MRSENDLKEGRDFLRSVVRRFRSLRMTEFALTALGIGFLGFSLTRLVVVDFVSALVVGIAVGFLILILRTIRSGIFRWNSLDAAIFINQSFPELKDSADLVVEGKPLTGLEAVQLQRTLALLSEVKPRVKLPHRVGQGVLLFAVGMMALLVLPSGGLKLTMRMPQTASPVAPIVLGPPTLDSIGVRISPPTYTQISAHSAAAHFSAPANSNADWHISFKGDAQKPVIIFSALDTVPLKPIGNSFKANRQLKQSSFYQVGWNDAEGKGYLSDFFRIDVKPDMAPIVEITNLEQFIEVGAGDSMLIEVRAILSDDYKVADAHLIATVSKGSGESVKFREEKLLFENAGRLPGKQAELHRLIDLNKLGLEPGDELYFYAEALDNRRPAPNLSRTETFFIALKDTAVAVAVADSGLGVDLMPEYFRSQRQIIIDTEKLLKEQRRIKNMEFNSRSNELGYDQKTLRLRYGQFLGEEDEAGIGVETVTPVDDEEDPDLLKQFGHQHDRENEHNLVDDKKGAKAEDHGHQEGDKEEDPMKAFMHEHDSQDEATFFVQSVKTKLKMALTLMWDSELHLRMYEPKKSLPFQYRILALLKEISQDSRVYVHRTGFDPPPIKEEKRLTGELDEVMSTTERVQADPTASYPAIQAALIHVEKLLQQGQPEISDSTRIIANRAGYEVATEELTKPGRYLQTLSDLRKLTDGSVPPEKLTQVLMNIRRSFWTILPVESYSPNRSRRTLHPLDRKVLDILNPDSRE